MCAELLDGLSKLERHPWYRTVRFNHFFMGATAWCAAHTRDRPAPHREMSASSSFSPTPTPRALRRYRAIPESEQIKASAFLEALAKALNARLRELFGPAATWQWDVRRGVLNPRPPCTPASAAGHARQC